MAKYLVSSQLKNENLWFWGFAWSLMWILLGAFVFNKDFVEIPRPYLDEAVRYYTAAWTPFFVVYVSSGVFVGLLYALVYQTGGIAYLRRYGKLTPGKLIYSYYLAMIIPSLALSSLLIALIASLFYIGFRHHGLDAALSSVLPKDPALGLAEVFGLSVLAFLFMQSLLFLMGVIALNTSPRHVGRMSFIPMMLTYVSYFTYLYLNMPSWALLINPFTAMLSAIAAVYAGMDYLPSQLIMRYEAGAGLMVDKAAPLYYGVLSAIAWTALLTALSIPLILRIEYKPAEELREL